MGRSKEAWRHTSALMALVANCHRGEESEPYQPRDFDPHAPPKPPEELIYVPITALKMFLDPQGR